MNPNLLLLLGLLFLLGASKDSPQGRVGLETANLRDQPQGDILGQLEPGTSLRILEQKGSWTRVEVRGWVYTPLLEDAPRVEKARPSPTPRLALMKPSDPYAPVKPVAPVPTVEEEP